MIFSVIDEAISQLQAHQFARKLNLELLVLTPPQYVHSSALETWQHFKAGALPVPWDPAIQQAHANLVTALASHAVFDATVGANVALSQHSTLESLNASIPGISSIRDNTGSSAPMKIVEHASYQRQLFVDTVAESVARNRDAFDSKAGFLGYFDMTDGQDTFLGESLNDALIGRLMTDFNNPNQPTLGLFQELLSDQGPTEASALGENLLRVSDDTYIMFQALTSWQNPFRGADKVLSMNPSTGIEHGYETYGATFFELYIRDIDGAVDGAVDANGVPLIDGLRFWNQHLTATSVPEPSVLVVFLGLAGYTFARQQMKYARRLGSLAPQATDSQKGRRGAQTRSIDTSLDHA